MYIRRLIRKVERNLDTRVATILCLTIAILVKSALFLQFFTFDDDKLFQAIAAKNLADGHGLVYFEVHGISLDKEIATPLNRWPPGYSILIAGIYKIVDNLEVSTLIVDLIFISTFFILLNSIMQRLAIPAYLINVLILFIGFAIGPYISMPTDLHAVVFVLTGIYFAMKFINSGADPVRNGCLIGIFCFLPSFFRYMYIPSSVVIGAVLVIVGLAQKNRIILKGGLCALAISSIGVSVMLLTNQYFSGSIAYVMPMHKGFYPGNLFTLYPFVYSSFLNINLIATQLELRTGRDYIYWYTIFVYLNFATCFFLLIKLSSRLFSLLRSGGLWNFFFLTSFGIIIVCMGLMGYLSVTNSLYRVALKPVNPWTFIGDGRYFVFAIVILPVLMVPKVFSENAPKYTRVFRYAFLSLFILVLVHTSSFLLNRLSLPSPLIRPTFPIEVENYLISRIGELKHQRMNVVLTGDGETAANWGFLHGSGALLNSDEIIEKLPRANRKSVLLLLTSKKKYRVYQSFLNAAGAPEAIIGDYHIYSFTTGKHEQ